ncbi:MAG: hypothetical protein WA063_03255 [Minisyncoccia bacterium]
MKNRKFLLFAIAVCVVFAIAVFLFHALFGEKEKPEYPVKPPVSKEKTREEIIDSLTVPVSGGEKTAPVSEGVINSITAPVNTNNNTATDSEINKTVLTAPISVPKDVLDSLTAPVIN